MKRLIAVLLAGLCASAYCAEEKDKPVPVMPGEVTLTTGHVLRNVQVIRWEKDRVVLKHSAGVDPIAFSLIKSVLAEDLAAMKVSDIETKKRRDEAVRAAAAARNDAEIAERELQARFEKLISEKSIAPGMTTDQVEKSWGRPKRKNTSGGVNGHTEQWVYEDHYVYFDDGKLTSWQASK